MEKNEFIKIAHRVVGEHHGWQTRIGYRLKRSSRSIRAYISGEQPIPDGVANQLAHMRAPWNWAPPYLNPPVILYAESGWITHTRVPRFIGQIRSDKNQNDTLPNSMIRLNETTIICDIFWIDEPVTDLTPELILGLNIRLEDMKYEGRKK